MKSRSGEDGAPEALQRDRKAEHLELARDRAMQVERRYFHRYRFEHVALPEISYDEIDLSTEFLGKRLRAPLLISCMTGGTGEAARINRNLAAGAERAGIALGLGSQRKAIEDPSQVPTFQVREQAPTIPLLANLGAVQLNYGYGVEECRRAVEMIEADALVFHLNVLQEAIQPEGDTDFQGLIPKMGAVARELDVPVIAKEIGCGISADVARKLAREGVRIVDAAGVGGTSWARIEASRAEDVPLGEVFSDWGIPTPEAIRQLSAVDGITVIGSGGLRSGLDVAKALSLGAVLGGMAQPFLDPATESADRVVEKAERIQRELKIAMLCVGAAVPSELREATLLEAPVA